MDKVATLNAIRAVVEAEFEGLTRMTAMSRDEATSSESKAENKYDTRALEASYLAAGQGERLQTLRKLVAWYQSFDGSVASERVLEGALVQTEDENGHQRWLFIAPAGGAQVRVGDETVTVVSLQSPLGRALAGCRPDDCTVVTSPKGPLEVDVIQVL